MEAPGSRAPGSSAGTFTSPTIGTGMRSNGWDPEAGNIEGCEGCEPKRPVMVEGSMFWMLSSLSMEGRWVLRADSPNTKANPSCSTLCTRDWIFADRKDSLRSSLLWLFWLGMLWMVTDFFWDVRVLNFSIKACELLSASESCWCCSTWSCCKLSSSFSTDSASMAASCQTHAQVY